MEYFKIYKKVVDKFEILQEDQWNFDETRYCINRKRRLGCLGRCYTKNLL